MSKHLNEGQIRALVKVGDCLVPGDEDLPSFSKLGCVEWIDHLLDPMPAADLKDLKMLLSILSFFPAFLMRALMRFLEFSPSVPGPLGAPLRLIRLGMRGLVMSLYYSGFAGKQYVGKTPLEVLEYKVEVYRG